MKLVRVTRLLTEAKAVVSSEPEEIDSFSHDGEEYDLAKVKQLVKGREVHELPVDELKWIIDDADDLGIDKKRLKTADVENPVIVIKWHGKWLVLDGAHRLSVAVQKKMETLPTRRILAAELATAKLGPSKHAN